MGTKETYKKTERRTQFAQQQRRFDVIENDVKGKKITMETKKTYKTNRNHHTVVQRPYQH